MSIIGHPLVRIFYRIKFGRIKLPHVLSALLTLVIMLGVITSFFVFFVPIIIDQASVISNVDVQLIVDSLKEPLDYSEKFLSNYGLLSESETIEAIVTGKIITLLGVADFSEMLNYVITFTGRVLISVFAICFITFFFLKEEDMFYNGVMLVTPIKYQDEMAHILSSSKILLTRYFIGLCIDVSLMITLLATGMSIIGVENAILIGFFAGIMNVVPYIGPIIGGIVGISLGVATNLGADFYGDTLPLMLKMTGVFITVNLTDAFLLQPNIYASSVRSHPLEIFLVIMIAGSIAGIPGMILAIPSYTFIRIIAKEFLSSSRLVKKLTEKM